MTGTLVLSLASSIVEPWGGYLDRTSFLISGPLAATLLQLLHVSYLQNPRKPMIRQQLATFSTPDTLTSYAIRRTSDSMSAVALDCNEFRSMNELGEWKVGMQFCSFPNLP